MWLNLDGAKIYNREVAPLRGGIPARSSPSTRASVREDGNCAELRRAVREDGLKGISSPARFAASIPMTKRTGRLRDRQRTQRPDFVHAAACPVDAPILDQYISDIRSAAGWTSRSDGARAYGGVLEDFPNVRFLMGHLGGMFYGCSTG